MKSKESNSQPYNIEPSRVGLSSGEFIKILDYFYVQNMLMQWLAKMRQNTARDQQNGTKNYNLICAAKFEQNHKWVGEIFCKKNQDVSRSFFCDPIYSL